MAKPEWGKKRTCQSCSARFYDLLKDPITCPKCEAVFDPLASLRPRRSRVAAAKAEPKPAPKPKVVAEADDESDELVSATDDDLAVEDDDDEALIEDASELGEDDDDVGPVKVSKDDC